MGVQVNIVSQQYLKQWINDADFSGDLSNYTGNLAGLVMQKIKLIQQIDINWFSKTIAPNQDSDYLQWTLTNPTATTINIVRNDGGDFLKDGFFAGDTIIVDLYTTSTLDTYTGSVSYVTSTNILLTFSSPSPIISGTNVVEIKGTTPLTSLIYNYGLVENNDQFSANSIINNEHQGWYTTEEVGADDGMGVRLTNTVTMEGLGVSNAWENGSCTVAYVSTTNNVQRYQIEHTFIIPYFKPGEITDLENNILPQYLAGSNSLKYVFESDFRTVLSNPNTSKKKSVTNILGSVGFYEEVFNGFDKNYYLDSISYTDNTPSLNSADGILQQGTTIVTAVIKKIVGNFGTDKVGVYFSYLPQLQTEVENTITTFEENFMYDNIFCEIGGGSQGGSGVLDDCLAVAVTNTLTVTFITDLTTAQQLRLNSQSKYILGFEVGDSSLSAGNSDAVILHTVNTFDVSADIPDLITNFDMAIYPHTEYFSGGGFTDFKGWIEDGLALNGSFEIDLDLEAIINSFNIYLIAYNSTSNSYFVLDQFNIPLGSIGSATAFGYTYQIINTNTTRGYQLVSGSEKNGVSLILDVGSVGTSTPLYEFTFAQKIKWQDWLKNNAVNNIFYNALKPQNNLNFKSSNYSNVFGYKIQMMFEINMAGVNALGVSGNTDYRFFTPNLRIYDYDLDSYTTPRFTQVIETFHPTTLANLGGAILVGEDTLFKTTWTDTWGAITDITNFWGIHRIEESGGVGNIYELSSYETNELTNNLLKTISGSFLTKTLTAGKLVTTCYIDGTKLANGVNYDISARIDSPYNPKVRQPDIRVSNTGDYRVDENGNYREVI